MQISANRMNLTIDLALQQGIEAHKEGKLREAERLYRAIIQAQPHHADANHNLGVLAVAVGKTSEALPMFKQALDANPNVEQFWLSYIDALIKSEHYDKALRLVDEAVKNGASLEKLKAFKAAPSAKVWPTANGLPNWDTNGSSPAPETNGWDEMICSTSVVPERGRPIIKTGTREQVISCS